MTREEKRVQCDKNDKNEIKKQVIYFICTFAIGRALRIFALLIYDVWRRMHTTPPPTTTHNAKKSRGLDTLNYRHPV